MTTFVLDNSCSSYQIPNKQEAFKLILSQNKKFCLSISLDTVTLWALENDNTNFLDFFSSDGNFDKEIGLFKDICWDRYNSFSILSTSGSILFFGIIDQTKIVYLSMLKSPSGSFFVSISSYMGYIVACDINGNISLLSMNSSIILKRYLPHNIIPKSISICGDYCLLLSGSSSLHGIQLNRSILTNPDYKISSQDLICESCIAFSLSPNGNLISAVNSEGRVMIKDRTSSYMYNSKISISSVSSCQWSADSLFFIVASHDGSFWVWSLRKRCSSIIKFPEHTGNLSFVISHYYLVSSNRCGIHYFPIIRSGDGKYPLLYSHDCVYDIRSSLKNGYAIPYLVPSIKEFFIEAVCCDNNEQWIIVGGKNKIFLINRSNGLYFIPNHQKLIIRGIAMIKKTIFVIHFDDSELIYYFFAFDFRLGKEMLIKYKTALPSRPIFIDSDDIACCVACSDRIFIFSESKFIAQIPIQSPPYKCYIHSSSKVLLVLFENRELSLFSLEDLSNKLLDRDISDVFYEPNSKFVIAQRGLKILLSSLDNFKFITFTETSDISIGIMQSCSSLVFLSPNSHAPFSPIINQFFDISIVSEMKNPDSAALSIKPLNKVAFFPNMVRQISIFALREKLGQECVHFLSYFPELRNESLVWALRAVESPERQGVFKEIGPPSMLFCEIGGLSVIQDKVYSFIKYIEKNSKDLKNASLLLPVIMEEEGPNVGFPAAFAMLSLMHNDIETIESLVRFLDPIVSTPLEIKEKKVNCAGIIISYDDYSILKTKLSEIITSSFIDLLNQYQPVLAMTFLTLFQYKARIFLSQNKSKDSSYSIVQLLDNLSGKMNEGKIHKNELSSVLKVFIEAEWDTWTIAILLLIGDVDRAVKLLNRNPHIKRLFQSSQWIHLIDI